MTPLRLKDVLSDRPPSLPPNYDTWSGWDNRKQKQITATERVAGEPGPGLRGNPGQFFSFAMQTEQDQSGKVAGEPRCPVSRTLHHQERTPLGSGLIGELIALRLIPNVNPNQH